MCLADQKIWKASKHILECKVYSQKFWDVKIWDLNRPLASVFSQVAKLIRNSALEIVMAKVDVDLPSFQPTR